MGTYEVSYVTGRRISEVDAWSETHAIDIVISGMKGGTFPETRRPFSDFVAALATTND